MARTTGEPTWLDLSSIDLDRSKTFYEQLFGWEFEDAGPQMNHYHMVRQNGALVGGAMDVEGMTCPDGDPLPSCWTVYLAVDDIDARAQKATENGGQLVNGPHPAGAAGKFAVLLDPSQAAVGMWQAGDTEGYEFSGETGTPVWFEVLTQDFDSASRFYTETFDFSLVPMQTPMDSDGDSARYSTNGPEAEATSGICDVAGFVPVDEGSFWRVYFAVDGCEEAVEKIESLGGKLLDGPEDSPFGRIATVEDSTGASFQICAPSEAVREG